jgi:probable HAF family extracellular repeat protein
MTTPSQVVPGISLLRQNNRGFTMIIPACANALRAIVGVAMVLLTSAAVADQFYDVTDLGTLGNTSTFENAFVTGINASGQLTGQYIIPGTTTVHAFITGPNGIGLTDLTPLDSLGSGGRAINNLGQVTGYFDGGGHAFISGPDGKGLTDLNVNPGFGLGVGRGINSNGQVTGNSINGLFITGPNGVGITYLQYMPGGMTNGINNSGQVGGSFVATDGLRHGFITGPNAVGVTDLGVGNFSALNSSGQMTGTAVAGSVANAFITGPNGVGMRDLGTLGGLNSFGVAINDSGEVVGFSELGGQSDLTTNRLTAFVYNGGPLVNLNTLIPTFESDYYLTNPAAINDSGQIVTSGYDCNTHQYEWFLLTPESTASTGQGGVCSLPSTSVPEPGTLSLLGLGLGAVLVGALRRRKWAEGGAPLT